MYDTAIYIGRFEPVHNGYKILCKPILSGRAEVILL